MKNCLYLIVICFLITAAAENVYSQHKPPHPPPDHPPEQKPLGKGEISLDDYRFVNPMTKEEFLVKYPCMKEFFDRAVKIKKHVVLPFARRVDSDFNEIVAYLRENKKVKDYFEVMELGNRLEKAGINPNMSSMTTSRLSGCELFTDLLHYTYQYSFHTSMDALYMFAPDGRTVYALSVASMYWLKVECYLMTAQKFLQRDKSYKMFQDIAINIKVNTINAGQLDLYIRKKSFPKPLPQLFALAKKTKKYYLVTFTNFSQREKKRFAIVKERTVKTYPSFNVQVFDETHKLVFTVWGTRDFRDSHIILIGPEGIVMYGREDYELQRDGGVDMFFVKASYAAKRKEYKKAKEYLNISKELLTSTVYRSEEYRANLDESIQQIDEAITGTTSF